MDRGPGPVVVHLGFSWDVLPADPVSLLLALPTLGDEDVPNGVRAAVAGAARAMGAVTAVDELADDLLRHRAFILQ